MEKDKLYPLSDFQLGMYLESIRFPEKTTYNLPYQFTLPDGIDFERLKAAIERVFVSHPALLTRIKKNLGVPMQFVSSNDLPLINVLRMSDCDFETFRLEYVKPKQIHESPLYRIDIVITETKSYLLFDIHHLIFDGTSCVIFMNDLNRAYCGEVLNIEQDTLCDYAEQQKKDVGNQQYSDSESFYDEILSGQEATEFPSDIKDVSNINPCTRISAFVGKDIIPDVRSFLKVTPNQLFHAASVTVLSRICRTENVTHNTLHHGRISKLWSDTTGYFVKTLPLVIQMKNYMEALDFINYVATQQKNVYANQYFPLIKINEKFGISPEIYYTYQGSISEEYILDGVVMKCDRFFIAQGGVSLMIYDRKESYEIRVVYDNTSFSYSSMKALADAVKCCVIDIANNPSKKVKDLNIVGSSKELLQLSSGGKYDYNMSETFISMFRKCVSLNPDNISVVGEDGVLTYSELDSYSTVLAGRLTALGLATNHFSGIMMPRKKEFMVAVIAVWKAGGAYLPLDNEYPNDRLLYMMEDSETKILITTKDLYNEKQREGDFDIENIIFIDEFNFNQKSDENLNVVSDPDGLAYMIYTSGSTGKPKGVMIKQKSLTCFIHSMVKLYDLNNKDRICCHSSFSFDASVEDLYPVLTIGGELHILAASLRHDLRLLNRYIIDKGITGGCYTTQLGIEFLSKFNPPVKYLTVGGEKMDKAPDCDADLYNTYGPTEFTVDSTYFKIRKGVEYKNIPIGRPLVNSYAYVLDMNQNLLPREFAGELCMSGKQIAAGYWKREDLTKEKFLSNPYLPGEKLYRTGDLVKWNNDGELEYLGRIDNQIKLRGFRIELGEIESALSRYEGIISSCVDVREVGSVQQLCAYYTSNVEINHENLRETLSQSLTEYMVPSLYMRLDSMPVTPNGKINRKALPTPDIERTNEFIAPQNDVQRDICEIFADLLKVPEISINDNFFEVGGTSLLAINALIMIENKGYNITYGDMFKYKTPEAIAGFIQCSSSEEIKPSDVYPIDDYDYTEIDRLLKSQSRDYWNSFETHDPGDVLLTGASGYLGAHILYELIHNYKGKIYCLLRSKRNIKIENTLRLTLMYYFGDTYDKLLGGRIIAIEGNIEDIDIDDKLPFDIDTIVNCAALVKHYEAGNDMERINCHAVGNLADLAVNRGARFVHVSTYSTGGVSINDSIPSIKKYSETDLFIGQSNVLKYTWTKFLAERLILEKIINEGLKAKIMRVGNLMGRARDGEFQINFNSNAFINSLKAYKVMGLFPLSQMTDKTEESPIDKVAESVMKLASTPDNMIVFHPYNYYPIDMGSIITAMKEYGFDIDIVSDSRFSERFNELMADALKSSYLSGILHSGDTSNVRYIGSTNDFTTTVLYRLGFSWEQTDKAYTKQLISMLDRMGFFDEKND